MRLPLYTAALLVLSACAAADGERSTATNPSADALRGQWSLTAVNGQAVPAQWEAGLDLNALPQVSGSMGCNHLTFAATPHSGSLKIGSITATHMMCDPELMANELRFAQAVSGQTVHYRIQNERMVWQTPDNSRFEFERRER